MAIGTIKINLSIKKWAKPIVFFLVLIGARKHICRWMLNIEQSK